MRNLTDRERKIGEIWKPIEYRCLLLMDEVSETTVSGRLIKPDISREREQVSQEVGRIITVGNQAFISAESGMMMEPTPKVGDRVLINRHAGAPVRGCWAPTGVKIGMEKEDQMKELDLRVIEDKNINLIVTVEEGKIELPDEEVVHSCPMCHAVDKGADMCGQCGHDFTGEEYP